MIKAVFLLCAVALVSVSRCAAEAQGLTTGGIVGLPLHSLGTDDLGGLKGPMKFVPGEMFRWSYAFDWSGTTFDGRRVALARDTVLTFEGKSASGLQFSMPGQPTFALNAPPNTELGNLLHLATVEVMTCNKASVLNRLGTPTSEGTAGPGETFVIYDAGVKHGVQTLDHESTLESRSKTGLVRTTDTVKEYEKAVTYTPYNFAIFFDTKDQVVRVEDRMSRSTRATSATVAAPATASVAGAAAAGAGTGADLNDQVWVNTKGGTIWKPGSVYYGKTKEGKYMSAAAALAAGYRYARSGGN